MNLKTKVKLLLPAKASILLLVLSLYSCGSDSARNSERDSTAIPMVKPDSSTDPMPTLKSDTSASRMPVVQPDTIH